MEVIGVVGILVDVKVGTGVKVMGGIGEAVATTGSRIC